MPRAEMNPEQKRRLADALRANLARRKQQARARTADSVPEPAPGAAAKHPETELTSDTGTAEGAEDLHKRGFDRGDPA